MPRLIDDDCVDCLIHELGLLLPECEQGELHYDPQVRDYYRVRLVRLRRVFVQLTEEKKQ